ncbi:exported hypothetical protein [Paraburkholderia ribeironis]|uniref:Uncharacterized protein n=1 Tax=Paraburkholderia ribeironis TaxID=1247936 RepID=A0A1N7RYU9_9BURK|nr:exported hypothetical protein [Paraburkholderia ribeironis]
MAARPSRGLAERRGGRLFVAVAVAARAAGVAMAAVIATIAAARAEQTPAARHDYWTVGRAAVALRRRAVGRPRAIRLTRLAWLTMIARFTRAVRATRGVLAMRRASRARRRSRAGVELDRGDRALVDALQADRRAQHHQVLIERLDAPGQANAVDKVDLDALSFFARSVHEVVLRVRFCGSHGQFRLEIRWFAPILPCVGGANASAGKLRPL